MHQYTREDDELNEVTNITASNIVKLFRICVEETYFMFNGKMYKQVNGLAIGASTSGFAAELFMQRLEERAIRTFTEPPNIYKRYLDDTFAKLKKRVVEDFLAHLNSQHPRIKFTTETQQNGKIAFLDTEVCVTEEGKVKVKVYRKATHTDQYLQWDSHHHISQKLGIITTFRHRIKTIVTEEKDREEEENHVARALRRCGHPKWSLNKKRRKREPKKTDNSEEEERASTITIPYVKGVSEKIARELKKHNIQTIHKPTTKLKHVLFNKMKDKVNDLDRSGVIYKIDCKRHKEIYIGETGRPMKERGREHRVVTCEDAKKNHSIRDNNNNTREIEINTMQSEVRRRT